MRQPQEELQLLEPVELLHRMARQQRYEVGCKQATGCGMGGGIPGIFVPCVVLRVRGNWSAFEVFEG